VTRPNVVVDARMAHDGGIGTYLQNLVPRIAAARPEWNFTVFGDVGALRALGWHAHPNVRLLHQGAPIYSLREQLVLPVQVGRAALYWAPNYNTPLLLRLPLVVTIHDVNHVALPELLGGRVRRGYARVLLTYALRRARQVLFDSEFTRQEAARILGDSATGTVVHLGVSDDWRTAREAAPRRPMAEPYFLYVGNVKRHKNVPLLLRAFTRVAQELPTHRIVLIGRREGLHADPEVTHALAQLGERALYLGEINRRTVQQYVVHADALVTASLYEGFGLPPLEAMAAGCPCVVSRAGSLPEVCGDAALYGDPQDEQSFADAMVRVAKDAELRAALVARGHAQAALFNWDRSASATASILHAALSAGT
jgi:glycosyltransferase involved in cell wall biosynthesis